MVHFFEESHPNLFPVDQQKTAWKIRSNRQDAASEMTRENLRLLQQLEARKGRCFSPWILGSVEQLRWAGNAEIMGDFDRWSWLVSGIIHPVLGESETCQ